jgi:hypothetical protein
MTTSLLNPETVENPGAGDPTRPNPMANPHGPAMMPHLLGGLKNLSPEELKRLDAAITPDAAYLLTKAFGPEMGALLWPLIVNDDEEAQGAEDTEVD